MREAINDQSNLVYFDDFSNFFPAIRTLFVSIIFHELFSAIIADTLMTTRNKQGVFFCRKAYHASVGFFTGN
jgi:hypothetical protein